jgi:Nif-specific regulatory protein
METSRLTEIEKLNTILKLNRLLNSTLEIDTLLNIILSTIAETFSAEASSIILLDVASNTLHFRSATGEKKEEIKNFMLKAGEGIAGWVVENGKSLLVGNPERDKRFHREISERMNFPTKSILCAPLKLESHVIGAIEILNPREKKIFSEEDLAFLEELSIHVALAVRNARLYTDVTMENAELKLELGLKHDIIGSTKAISDVLHLVSKIASSDINVLITGDSGTGKELVARAIHANSSRARGPFVSVNCAAIPDTLLESELFGYEKGAFTGATTSRRGRVEQADSGTLFLDEIGDMTAASQAKILRVIQDRKVERIGSEKGIEIDTRLIAATNKNLAKEMSENRFRQDLFYRLNEVYLHLPSLEERREDIPLLVNHFVAKYSKLYSRTILEISKGAMGALMKRSWPGNIRELENTIKRAIVLLDGERLTVESLDYGNNADGGGGAKDGLPPVEDAPLVSLAEAEAAHIDRVLAHTNWKKAEAAKLLGISRPTLDRKIEHYSLKEIS